MGVFDRTQALFRVWRDSRTIEQDDKDKLTLVKYYDGAAIMATSFTVYVGSEEFTSDSLEEVERWLWNNWVRQEKEAGEV